MQDTDTGVRAAARAAATSIASLGLAGTGGVLAWFAFIDAPISDGAMALVALGVLCSLWSRELLLAVPAADAGGSPAGQSLPPGRPAPDALARATLLRRAALVLLLLALLLLALATLATLNLRGDGANDSEDARTTAWYHLAARGAG
jgi:hypothetical protein